MEKLYYTIGEAAQMLGEPVSKIRYWSSRFPERLDTVRDGGTGKRKYTAGQIEFLRQIKFLTSEQGLTLEGAKMQLERDPGRSSKVVKAVEALKEVRELLLEIRKTI